MPSFGCRCFPLACWPRASLLHLCQHSILLPINREIKFGEHSLEREDILSLEDVSLILAFAKALGIPHFPFTSGGDLLPIHSDERGDR
jgi:hypothetical protein